MSPTPPVDLERFSGFADCYDAYRPQLPAVIADILCQLAGTPRPNLVADLGCGTGLSMRLWVGRAQQVVGIEPNPDMRQLAQARFASLPAGNNLAVLDGNSAQTGLPDGSADIVTCSQSLHWMEPQATFAEVARILRPGGVFAACDCDWPPTLNRPAEEAYTAFTRLAAELERERSVPQPLKWPKGEHLTRMRESGRFRFVKEILVHSVETGNADRLVGLALSQGGIQTLLKRGVSQEELGLDRFRQAAESALGPRPSNWYFSYRLRIGMR